LALEPGKTELAAISDEAIWIKESFLAAKQTANATPIGNDEGPYNLNAIYKAAARIRRECQAGEVAVW